MVDGAAVARLIETNLKFVDGDEEAELLLFAS